MVALQFITDRATKKFELFSSYIVDTIQNFPRHAFTLKSRVTIIYVIKTNEFQEPIENYM